MFNITCWSLSDRWWNMTLYVVLFPTGKLDCLSSVGLEKNTYSIFGHPPLHLLLFLLLWRHHTCEWSITVSLTFPKGKKRSRISKPYLPYWDLCGVLCCLAYGISHITAPSSRLWLTCSAPFSYVGCRKKCPPTIRQFCPENVGVKSKFAWKKRVSHPPHAVCFRWN